MTTLLAISAFLAGHFTARACLFSMSLGSFQRTGGAHSCCRKHAPEAPKSPQPKACCCADGLNLATVEEPGSDQAPDAGAALDAAVLSPRGAAPPDAPPDRPPPRKPGGRPPGLRSLPLLI